MVSGAINIVMHIPPLFAIIIRSKEGVLCHQKRKPVYGPFKF